jgi:hypothetical protein
MLDLLEFLAMMFGELVKQCSRLDCDVVVEDRGGLVWLLIRHREHGPIVAWCTFRGSVEETARYALGPIQRALGH